MYMCSICLAALSMLIITGIYEFIHTQNVRNIRRRRAHACSCIYNMYLKLHHMYMWDWLITILASITLPEHYNVIILL